MRVPVYAQFAVNSRGVGLIVSSLTPDMSVKSGVAYVDNSHVLEKGPGVLNYTLSYVNIADGVSRPGNIFEYYIIDHLGSTKAVMSEGTSTWQIKEAMSYLAYGAVKSLLQQGADKTRQKFTGKELDEDGMTYDEQGGVVCAGMMLNYFGARYYDADVGVWTSTDPKAQYTNLFSYCNGNPVNRIDPDGNNDFNVGIDVEAFSLSMDCGFVADFNDGYESGLYRAIGEGTGGSIGAGLTIGWTFEDVEGVSFVTDMNWGLVGGTLIQNDKGYIVGGSITIGKGVGALTRVESHAESFTAYNVMETASKFVQKIYDLFNYSMSLVPR